MSGNSINRRGFLTKASALTAATSAFSFEEQSLLAYQQRRPTQSTTPDSAGPMPTGKLGNLNVSRLIAGHNLVGATAHARDLIYVSQLLRAYFTDDKILDTYRKYEEAGINTAFLRVEARQLQLAKRYREECGGKLQWMAQLVINEKDLNHDLDLAMELGVQAAYVRGLEGDRFFKAGRLDLIAKAVEKIKACKIPAGAGSHLIDTLMAVEREGIPADFYFKTFNSAQYWSAGSKLEPDPNWRPTKEELVQSEYAPGNHDNLWETTPAQTKAFFEKVEKPFIAYKVLAAGAIHPRDGFEYAFANGADFVAVGMYDFQIAEDVSITKQLFAKKLARTRPWRA
ncbi:MAG: hypothetical protein C5B51_15400 [Terriglobia bacterium]|nr:MAG: hypothetical protein C5B51_15400 [Terriglobia bacterium]